MVREVVEVCCRVLAPWPIKVLKYSQLFWQKLFCFWVWIFHFFTSLASFYGSPPPPTSHEHELYGVTSGLTRLIMSRGGSRIFSRGGGRIFKKISKFLTSFFFLGWPNWFFELSQSTVLPLFWQNFLRRRQIFKKTVKKAVFGYFLKNFDKKIAFFFGARSPSKLAYIGA